MNNLILGIATNLSSQILERYLLSARRTGYEGRIILLLKERDLNQEIVTTITKYQGEWAVIPDLPVIEVCLRFPLFLEILKREECKLSNGWVLHTDVRDVIFQRDPFPKAQDLGSELYFALEDCIIGENIFNSHWILEGFGPEILANIKDKQASCAGTTMGTFQAMLTYFDLMSQIIFKDADFSANKYNSINDQGVHNFLLYNYKSDLFKPVGLNNESGLFLNMGIAKQVGMTNAQEFSTSTGEVACVVHQLDRLRPEVIFDLQSILPYSMEDLLRKSVERQVIAQQQDLTCEYPEVRKI